MKAKNTQPYIDYDKAKYLTRLYDFINRANQMRKNLYSKLDYLDFQLAITQNCVSEMKATFAPLENPNVDCTSHDDDIKALRAFAWEAGLTQTLFEKLKDREFRDRFAWGVGKPVTREEIEERYDDE